MEASCKLRTTRRGPRRAARRPSDDVISRCAGPPELEGQKLSVRGTIFALPAAAASAVSRNDYRSSATCLLTGSADEPDSGGGCAPDRSLIPPPSGGPRGTLRLTGIAALRAARSTSAVSPFRQAGVIINVTWARATHESG